MEPKDIIAIGGIGATLLVSAITLVHSLSSERRTSFVNTVTTSRLKWIDSLRDKVSEFIAVTARLARESTPEDAMKDSLTLQRDTLLHQIVLHLNPHDPEDQKIRILVDHVCQITNENIEITEISRDLEKLRSATADYLKKEWNRVKAESTKGRG
jgi:hypothetical protein